MTGIEVVVLSFRLELCVIWMQSSSENISNMKRWRGEARIQTETE